MSSLRQAAQQALEALEDIFGKNKVDVGAITALRAALAEPEQEPVAWRYEDSRGNYRYRKYVSGFDDDYSILKPVPLYTATPKRPLLTDEEINDAWREAKPKEWFVITSLFVRDFARAIERKVRGE